MWYLHLEHFRTPTSLQHVHRMQRSMTSAIQGRSHRPTTSLSRTLWTSACQRDSHFEKASVQTLSLRALASSSSCCSTRCMLAAPVGFRGTCRYFITSYSITATNSSSRKHEYIIVHIYIVIDFFSQITSNWYWKLARLQFTVNVRIPSLSTWKKCHMCIVTSVCWNWWMCQTNKPRTMCA